MDLGPRRIQIQNVPSMKKHLNVFLLQYIQVQGAAIFLSPPLLKAIYVPVQIPIEV